MKQVLAYDSQGQEIQELSDIANEFHVIDSMAGEVTRVIPGSSLEATYVTVDVPSSYCCGLSFLAEGYAPEGCDLFHHQLRPRFETDRYGLRRSRITFFKESASSPEAQ